MKRSPARRALAATAAVLVASSFSGSSGEHSADAENWPSWRGPDRNGVAPGPAAPTTWGEDSNVRWKVELPGLGISTPILWKDRLYVTTAVKTDRVPEGADAAPAKDPEPEPEQEGRRRRRRRTPPPTNLYEFRVLCLDRADGSVVWDTKVAESVPHEAGHNTNSQASASPITDGEHVWAFFGSRGLHCLDMKGEVVWSKEFGRMQTRNQFGEGASPALYGDTIVVLWDHEGEDFIAALEKTTGEEKWRKSRDEPTSWVTPLIVPVGDRVQVITTATGKSRAYDLETGEIIWSIGGMTTNCIPMPIEFEGIVYLMSGFRGAALQAIQLEGAEGDLDESDQVLWEYGKGTSYVPSGVLADGKIHFLRGNTGVLSCLDAISGDELYTGQKLGGIRMVYASLTASGDHVYCVARGGETIVFRVGEEFEEVASNVLDDEFDASPVIVDGEIYLRGRASLYCIAKLAD
ncbi:MAG: PQQ-binding-like beta-propeller repeat protein [Planctomycetota bacterium]